MKANVLPPMSPPSTTDRTHPTSMLPPSPSPPIILPTAFIVWLMKANVLPEATPSVLSQVAFQALIPCFMMTKVASTLSVQPLSSLAFLPLLAIFQL
ncbi:unnamed protein product [Closterium sp. Naga37s-1]|nr:unnamed protein product [Closterium sp. Naga37s-1]